MTPIPCNEDHLVEQPLALLAELGWQSASGLEETFAEAGGSLERLNPDQPAESIAAAIEELIRNRSSMALVSVNRELYRLLKDGVLVSMADPERGGQRKERLRGIDWHHPANNDFLAVTQFTRVGHRKTAAIAESRLSHRALDLMA